MKNTIALPRWLEGIDGIILVNNPDNFFIELHLNFVDTRLSGDISQPIVGWEMSPDNQLFTYSSRNLQKNIYYLQCTFHVCNFTYPFKDDNRIG